MRLGLVSDTHGLFEPLLPRLFAGCELILHAGDVVKHSVLTELARIAPVRAVRGNNDLGPLGESLPEMAVVHAGDLAILVVHQLPTAVRPSTEVRTAVAREGARVVVYGHSHRPSARLEDGILYVNPGSAGPRRFSLPRTAGLLDVEGASARVALYRVEGLVPAPLGEPLSAQF